MQAEALVPLFIQLDRNAHFERREKENHFISNF